LPTWPSNSLALEQPGQRSPRPARVHAGEVDLGDQGLGAMGEPLVGGQQVALPFLLASLVVQTSARHRQRERTKRGDQLARPVPMAPTTGDRTSLVTPTAERGLELLLQELLDKRAHLTAYRLLQRIEPVAAGER